MQSDDRSGIGRSAVLAMAWPMAWTVADSSPTLASAAAPSRLAPAVIARTLAPHEYRNYFYGRSSPGGESVVDDSADPLQDTAP